ncbi:MAG: hypothetical protein WC812_02485 [Candidatus Pacearchaeota archaeon]
MTNKQRMENDLATMDRREAADNTMDDNRIRNDKLTTERRANIDRWVRASKTTRDNRIRNDELTGERRFKADQILGGNRLRNDELTANRREIRDGPSIGLTVFLLIVAVLAIGASFIFI